MREFAILTVLGLAGSFACATTQSTKPTAVPTISPQASVISSQGTAAPSVGAPAAGMTADAEATAPAAGDLSQLRVELAGLQARYDDLAGINRQLEGEAHDLHVELDRARMQVAFFANHKAATPSPQPVVPRQPVAYRPPVIYQQRPTFSGYSACGPSGCAPVRGGFFRGR